MIGTIRSRSAHGRSQRRGQAVVEFAMVAPIFFLVLFAMIEGGRFVFVYETLNNATREGARYAIVNGANSLGCPTGPPAPGTTACDPTGEAVKQEVRQAAFGAIGGTVTVTPIWAPDNGRGSTVTVTATHTYRPLIPLVPFPDITVTAESSLVVNN